MVEVVETKTSIGHYLTSLCAIVGGVFTVFGIIDNVLHSVLLNSSMKNVITPSRKGILAE